MGKLEQVKKEYEQLSKDVESNSMALLEERYIASKIIMQVDLFLNELANKPKEFTDTFENVHINLGKFQDLFEEKNNQHYWKVAGGVMSAGVGTGIGVASMGPSAAMAIATAYGKSSTGTSISSLPPAAAKTAALAWLGGGARAAGGGGVAAGKAVLALTKPVGLAIGGIALIGSVYYLNRKNKQAAENALKEIEFFKKKLVSLKAENELIESLLARTYDISANLSSVYRQLKNEAPSDYYKYSSEQKSLIDHLVTKSMHLSEVINIKVAL